MTEIATFTAQIEQDLKKNRKVSPSSLDLFSTLPMGEKNALWPVMHFLLGEYQIENSKHSERPVQNELRVTGVRLMLLKLSVDTSNPRWSSFVLDCLLNTSMRLEENSLNHVFEALNGILKDKSYQLTETVANFIKELVIVAFTKWRNAYNSSDFKWLVDQIASRCSIGQAYLCLHAIPPSQLTPSCRVDILRALKGTDFWGEGIKTLEDDLNDDYSQQLLSAWLSEGILSPYDEDIRRIVAK